MAGPNRTHLADARGASRMLLDATAGIVDAVERMHRTIQRVPGPLGRHVVEPTRGITGLVYRGVRGGVDLVGRGLDASLAPLERFLPPGDATPGRDAFVAVANGVYGDYLERTGNPLAIAMSLRFEGATVDPSAPQAALTDRAPVTDRVLLLVHGLCMTDGQWVRDGRSHGTELAQALGATPLYLRYNSGRPIAANGRALAELLETLALQWPVPLEQLTIVGHSMGGLVARSACHHAARAKHGWLARLRQLVFLGTPHHGSPLERGGHGLDYLMQLSPYSAPIARLAGFRSAGIQDLRHGTVTAAGARMPRLPAHVDSYAIAAVLAARRSRVPGRCVGDGLVTPDSALGRHRDPKRTLAIPAAHRWVAYGMGHLDLLHRPEVQARVRTWLAGGA
jgi:pimeloyl-ACP methyl ester carboxylesterase